MAETEAEFMADYEAYVTAPLTDLQASYTQVIEALTELQDGLQARAATEANLLKRARALGLTVIERGGQLPPRQSHIPVPDDGVRWTAATNIPGNVIEVAVEEATRGYPFSGIHALHDAGRIAAINDASEGRYRSRATE